MSRHQTRPTTVAEAIARARSMVQTSPVNAGILPRPIRYKLGEGGIDPAAPHPATPDEDNGNRLAADCAGFVAWALGFDRYQRADDFPVYEGWINTDSMITEARQHRTWFEELAAPEPGAVVVYPSRTKNGERVRIGHVGLVVQCESAWDASEAAFRQLVVVHCNGSTDRDHGYSVAETGGRVWFGSDKSGAPKNATFLRYRRFA